MTFCDNLLQRFSENLKQLTKINDFLLFLRFHKNLVGFCTVFKGYIRRYEFCMYSFPSKKKYPSKFIFTDFALFSLQK